MERRVFLRTAALAALAAPLAGCGDETKQTGSVVETPAEDKASMEASAAAYKAAAKKSQPSK
jgi:hypothetical protein